MKNFLSISTQAASYRFVSFSLSLFCGSPPLLFSVFFPFLPHQVMHMFKGCRREDTAPHIYAVAQSAYRNLLTTRQDQSIVLLGKSGTGKTTNCQHLVQYLVSIAGSTGKIFSGESADRIKMVRNLEYCAIYSYT